MDVFISYPNTEKPLAEALRKKLEDAGLGVFVDTVNLTPGTEWQKELEKGVESAKLFLVLIDPEQPPSRSQQAEWQAALETVWKHPGKRLVPVLPRGAEVPAFARSASGERDVQVLRLDDEKDLEPIVQAAKDLIGGRRRPVHPRLVGPKSVPVPMKRVPSRMGKKNMGAGSSGDPGPSGGAPRSALRVEATRGVDRDREERLERLAEIRRFANDLKK